MELHTVYIIQLYIHITVLYYCYLPKMFVLYIYGQFRAFPGLFFTIHDFELILKLKTSFYKVLLQYISRKSTFF